jgi:diacylglycerol kinase (ATP)
MIGQIKRSFGYAIQGLRTTWREEHNFRIEVVVAFIVVCAMIYFKFTFIESILCILAIVLVLSAEIVNTAIEDMADLIDANPNPLVGKIKDTMAGFVLISALGSAIIGTMVFYHHFFA